MKATVVFLSLLLARAVAGESWKSFYCCPSWSFSPDSIYESLVKFNMSEGHKRNASFCENTKCSRIEKMQNVRENFVRTPESNFLVRKIQNAKCKTQVTNWIHEIHNSATWAIEMFDASSKLPSGLITGNTFQFGNFDQCINAYSQEYSIKGKYCLANIHFVPQNTKYPPYYKPNTNNEFSIEYNPYKSMLEKLRVTKDFTKKRRNFFHSGICIPDECSNTDAEIIVNHFLWPKAKEFGYHVNLSIRKNSCTTNDIKPISFRGKLLGFIIVGFVLFVIFCTVRDIFIRTKRASGQIKLYFEELSLLQTIPKLYKQNGDGRMNVFNGMKSLSMVLIIMGHRCMATCGGPFFNPEFLEKRYRKIENILLLNGTLIVDTFFLIGGYLTFITLHKVHQNQQKIKPLTIYFYRGLRIVPVYMLVIFFYAYLLEHIGTGPVWSIKVGKEAERCRNNWWTNFLFINNYVNTDSLCMFQSWYVTCDMHFVLFAPFVVNLAAKSQKKGFLMLLTLITISLLTSFFVTYYNKYDGVLRVYISTFEDLASSFTFNRVYIKTHNRATPYFTGMAAAFIYVKLKRAQYRFSTWQIWIASVFAVVFALSAICGAWLFYIPGREYNALENALYASLHRLLWALSMSWIALAGGTQAFGIIEPILSHKFFIPFSKLSFTAFLVHGAVQMYSSASLRVPEHMSFSKLYWMTCGDVMLSFFFAFLLYIFFEAPLKTLQKLVSFKQKKQ